MSDGRKYRVSLCYMVFADLEIECPNANIAEFEALRNAQDARRKFSGGPVAYRIEHLVPSAVPGKFEWREVPRA
jgi:hypothetical protein